MNVGGIPIDETPALAHFAGGAGGAIQGFLQGQGAIQGLLTENEQLKALIAETMRRNRYTAMAEREQDLAFEKFQASQDETKRERETDERRRRAMASIFAPEPLRRRDVFYGPPAPSSQVVGEADDDGLGQQPFLGKLREGIASGALTLDQADKALKLRNTIAAGRHRKQLAKHAWDEIHDDEMPDENGIQLWSNLGVEGVDVNDDGTPDVFASTPQAFRDRLRAGEDPAKVLSDYRALRGEVLQHRHKKQVWREFGAQLGAKYAQIEAMTKSPADRAAARVIAQQAASGWYEHEYKDPELAAQVAEEDYSQALSGYEPRVDKTTGIRSYSKREDRAAIEAREADLARVKEYNDTLSEIMGHAVRLAGDAPKREDFLDLDDDKIDAAYEKALAVHDQRFAASMRDLVQKYLPPELQAVAAARAQPGGAQPSLLMVKPPTGSAPGAAARDAGPSAAASQPATQTAWTDLSSEQQTQVLDTLKGGRKVAGFDLNSLPEQQMDDIRFALGGEPKKLRGGMYKGPTDTVPEPPGKLESSANRLDQALQRSDLARVWSTAKVAARFAKDQALAPLKGAELAVAASQAAQRAGAAVLSVLQNVQSRAVETMPTPASLVRAFMELSDLSTAQFNRLAEMIEKDPKLLERSSKELRELVLSKAPRTK